VTENRNPDSPSRLPDRVTLILFAVALAAGFAMFGATTSLNDVARHFGHQSATGSLRSVVGLSGSVLGLGLAALRVASLGALPLASLADRRGRTKVLRSTLVLGLLLTAGAALSPGYWPFVACFALARPLLTVASSLVQVITVELESTALRIQGLVIMAAGAGIGSGLSAVLHGVIRGSGSFRWLFALALVPVLAIGPLLRAIPEPVQRVDLVPLARLGAVPRGVVGRLAIVATMAFTIGVITGPSGGFTFVYSEGVLKMSPALVATVVVCSGVVGLAGLLASRRLSRTMGRRWTVALGVMTTSVASTYAYSGGRIGFVVGYVLSVGAGGLLSPAMTAMSTEIFAHNFRATAVGWITVAGVVGAVAGLGLFGWVGDAVHASSHAGMRVPALVTFLPFLPTLLLLTRLPESRGMELA
jgi:MFS family permease